MTSILTANNGTNNAGNKKLDTTTNTNTSNNNNTLNNSKLDDLLDSIRLEFSQLSQEANTYRLQNQKDYDLKTNRNLAEMQQIRNTVYELELTHRKMKDAYEEQIKNLKLELDTKEKQLQSLSSLANRQAAVGTTTTSTPNTNNNTTTNNIVQPLQQPPQIPVPQQNSITQQSSLPQAQVQIQPTTTTTTTEPQQQPNQLQQTNIENNTLPQLQSDNTTNTTTTTNIINPERANHNKPIPNFLLDLDPKHLPNNFKKITDDYYILYNPDLPKTLDVDLHLSLTHPSVVCCVKFSNDGQFLATGCNKTTRVYKVSTGELIATLLVDPQANINTPGTTTNPNVNNNNTNNTNNTNNDTPNTNESSDLYIRSVCFSPDGKFLAAGAEDKLIRIWDITTKQIVMILKGHEQDIYSLDYFPSGEKLVSGSGDKTVRIWDLRTGQCSLTLSIEDGVTTVASSPNNGKYIAAGSLDRSARVWDTDTGFLLKRLDAQTQVKSGHKDSIYSVAFTKDGSKLVSGSLDRSVKLWNLDNSTNNENCEVTFIGHKDFVLSVTTSQNDEYVLSGSKDRGVLFWDIKTGDPLLMLQGHKNSVISVAVANGYPLGTDYGVFATGSGDFTAKIWRYKKISDTNDKKETYSY